MNTKILLFSMLIIAGENIILAQDQNNFDSINSKLSGKWIWKSCYGGYSGICSESPGPENRRSVVFSETSTDSISFNVEKNDSSILSGITKFVYQNTTFGDKWTINKDVIHGTEISETIGYYIIKLIDTDKIEFMQPCKDCYYYRYEKENILMEFNNFNNEKGLIFFPNPNNGILFINNILPFTQIEIINTNGKIVKSENIILNTDNILYDISKLKSGIYVIRLISSEEINIEKIIRL